MAWRNRFFDSLSLRYLYQASEIYEVRPNGDEFMLPAKNNVTEESTEKQSTDVGISAKVGK